MEIIQLFYRNVTGKRPEQTGAVELVTSSRDVIDFQS